MSDLPTGWEWTTIVRSRFLGQRRDYEERTVPGVFRG